MRSIESPMRHALGVLLLVLGGFDLADGADRTLPPKPLGALLGWLRSGVYRETYTPEPAVRVSSTAHGMHVRTWYAPSLVEDLRGGTLPFRPGAAMVKELYFDGDQTVVGWSVMRKVRRRSARGRGWFFFETLNGRTPIARGRGIGLCVSCHEAGRDFLLTEFRPGP
jgi:hypothetical protein